MQRLIILLIFILAIPGCKGAISPSAAVTASLPPASLPVEATAASIAPSMIPQDETFSKYLVYLKVEKLLDDEDKLIFSVKEDLDLDNHNEVILAFGIAGDDPVSAQVNKAYVLRETAGKIEPVLGDLLVDGSGYGIYEIKLVHMQDTLKPYIYCGVTNGGPLLGFALYELSDNKLQRIEYSASATGSGEDMLTDSNKDGQWDGYVQNRSSYDVLYYPVVRAYTWEKHEFIRGHTSVEIRPYPNTVKDVLVQFLTLSLLQNENSPEVDQRLKELNSSGSEFTLPSDIWYPPISQLILDLDSSMDIVVKEGDNEANATISYTDDDSKSYKLVFHLKKTEQNWTIDQIN